VIRASPITLPRGNGWRKSICGWFTLGSEARRALGSTILGISSSLFVESRKQWQLQQPTRLMLVRRETSRDQLRRPASLEPTKVEAIEEYQQRTSKTIFYPKPRTPDGPCEHEPCNGTTPPEEWFYPRETRSFPGRSDNSSAEDPEQQA
jgi:hypothetical protein